MECYSNVYSSSQFISILYICKENEIYYVDEQTCDNQHLFEFDSLGKTKWYKIMLYKPKGIKDLDKCKWLVSESYSDYIGNNDPDYEKYELDFKNHCIKL